jgi:predicted DsbA family dithiol-disulfide isomerase
LNRAAFESCLTGDARGGKFAEHIQSDYQNASDSGGNGTPYSVVIAPNGKSFPISGGQPYRVVKAVIDMALQEK